MRSRRGSKSWKSWDSGSRSFGLARWLVRRAAPILGRIGVSPGLFEELFLARLRLYARVADIPTGQTAGMGTTLIALCFSATGFFVGLAPLLGVAPGSWIVLSQSVLGAGLLFTLLALYSSMERGWSFHQRGRPSYLIEGSGHRLGIERFGGSRNSVGESGRRGLGTIVKAPSRTPSFATSRSSGIAFVLVIRGRKGLRRCWPAMS